MPLFQSLTIEQIKIIQEQIHERKFAPGELVYQLGNEADTLYLVQKGKIQVYRLSNSGKKQHLRVLEPGDFIGVAALFNDRHYEHIAKASEPTTICCIQRDDFKQIILNNPHIALELLSVLSDRLDHSEQQTTWITSESVQSRLANYILEEGQKQKSQYVVLTLIKKDIASFLGMSPETFSRGITKLTKNGLIKQSEPNVIEILDSQKLNNLIME